MFHVFLGLGSNVGDRLKYLTKAMEALQEKTTIQAVSSVYETEALGMELQALPFYNMVIEIETELFPSDLMKALKKIEKEIGRKPNTHMMPREIDIDIEMYRGYSYEDARVKVPHSQLESRRFVLEPLYEIAPTAVHPVSGKTIGTLLRQCTDRSRVIRTDHVVENIVLKERRKSAANP